MRTFHKILGCSLLFTSALLPIQIAWARARSTPPAHARTPSLDILIYGDAGTGDAFQRQVGASMWERHRAAPFDLAVSMGDNQYVDTDPTVFRRIFEEPYAPLIAAGVPFFQTIGNHDMEKNRLADQLAYSARVDALRQGKGGFVLPSENYVIERPNLRWIVLNVAAADNSIRYPDQTRAFAEREICAPSPGWKIVSFHYPLWSSGPRGDNGALQSVLLPLFDRCPVDFIFTGHEHHAEAFLPYDWMQFHIVGNGREIRTARPVSRSARESLHYMGEIGHAELRLHGDAATYALVNARGEEVYASTLQRKPDMWIDVWKQRGETVLGRVKFRPEMNTDGVEVEALFAQGQARDPVLHPEDWTAVPAVFSEGGDARDLFAYVARIPRAFRTGKAFFRARLSPDARWIYGDLSDRPGQHGNYDGIQSRNALTLRDPKVTLE